MEEMVTLSRYDLIYYGFISGCLAFVWYELANLYVLKVLPWLKEKKKQRKEKRNKNK